MYGGLIASLIDCHGTGTAAAASYRFEKRDMDTLPALRFVTAKLTVEYLRPTPLDATLEIRGRVVEVTAKKVHAAITLSARNKICARGEVVAIPGGVEWPQRVAAGYRVEADRDAAGVEVTWLPDWRA